MSHSVPFELEALRHRNDRLSKALLNAARRIEVLTKNLRTKDAEIAQLRRELPYRAPGLVEVQGVRHDHEVGRPVGLPYCPYCEGVGLLVRLSADVSLDGHPYRCKCCAAIFGRDRADN
jgi:hypothetical protein